MFTYSRTAPNGYEVSSAGDRRFSALYARLSDGRTIEEAYQLDIKGYRIHGNDWRLGKGKPSLDGSSSEDLYRRYLALWRTWAGENPELISELRRVAAGRVLTDKYAASNVSQARALADILNSPAIIGDHNSPCGPFYTGVGSRRTPPDVLSRFRRLAAHLETQGWILRSGGADGADKAFEEGVDRTMGPKEIYLPWRLFNGNPSLEFTLCSKAREVAAAAHPAWERCSDAARKLHTRNVYQVMGRDLKTPSVFVACWTPDGAQDFKSCTRNTGGTAMAIRIASAAKVPVFNFQRADAIPRLRQFLETTRAV